LCSTYLINRREKDASVVSFPKQLPSSLALLSSPLLTLRRSLPAFCFPFPLPAKTNYQYFLLTSENRLPVFYQKLQANPFHYDVTNLLSARILADLIYYQKSINLSRNQYKWESVMSQSKFSEKILGTFNNHPIEFSKADILVLRTVASLSMHYHYATKQKSIPRLSNHIMGIIH
jgi:hypothetical protein